MNENNVEQPLSKKEKRRLKRKNRSKISKFFRWVLLVIFFGILFVIADALMRTRGTFNQIHRDIEVPSLREEQGLDDLTLGEDPFSVLILGIDGGRSDSMMVATVNPNTNSSYLVSIPRDTMVNINGTITRINHAYAWGGPDLAIETVQNFLNIPIDYFATLQMDAFPALVDAFGGVTVDNDFAFSFGGYHFPVGEVRLTGNSAYYFARMRMDDPRGDHGRAERQRDILNAMAAELAGVTVVSRYQNILDAVGQSMETNVTLGEMMTISLNYTRALGNITNLDLAAPGRIWPEFGGMYLIQIHEYQLSEMQTRLRNHLEL